MGWRDLVVASQDPAAARWRWPKNSDFNGDGIFTISDIWQGCGWVLHMPGDLVLSLLGKWESLTRFLEIADSVELYGGTLSLIASLLIWALILWLLARFA